MIGKLKGLVRVMQTENEAPLLSEDLMKQLLKPEKYCVRLYLAGEWRRVFVDDSVPLTVDGNPALASSSDRLELWPLLLAKAIYSVYSACGYADVVGDVLDQPVDPAAATAVGGESAVQSGPYPAPNLPRAQCIAHFTSFALHVMTGKRIHSTHCRCVK